MDIRFSVFIEKVRSGEVLHSIRFWEIPPIVGESLTLRDAKNNIIANAVCTKVLPISIEPLSESVSLDGAVMLASEIEELAINDGFDHVDDFWVYFEKKPYLKNGWLICWDLYASDGINNPSYYQKPSSIGLPMLKLLGIRKHLLGGDVTCIHAIEQLEIQGFRFVLLSAIKYLWRAGNKPGQPLSKDLREAKFYLCRFRDWDASMEWTSELAPSKATVEDAIAMIDELLGANRH
jgi:hypothetical protein